MKKLLTIVWVFSLNGYAVELKEGIGYGAGDTTQEAIEVAKRDAVLNAAGMSVDVNAQSSEDQLLDKKLWMRGCGVLWKYETIEKGESIGGTYARVKAQIEPYPLTRPLKEATTLGFKVKSESRDKIIKSAVAGLKRAPIDVMVVGFGKDRDAALKMAWYNAVGEAVGRFYEISSKLENGEIARDQSMEISNGYVESCEIVEEQTLESGTVRILIRAKVREGSDYQESDSTPPCRAFSLSMRKSDAKTLFMTELDNMKSVVPYLYEIKITDISDAGSGNAWVSYRIGVNWDVYNSVFMPRFIQVLMRVTEKDPVELTGIGSFNEAENDVFVKIPNRRSGADLFGVTIVDRVENGELAHAFNFTLAPELRRMLKEWKREVFLNGVLKFKVKDEEGLSKYESDEICVKAKKLHNTPIPYYAKGWGFWYDDLWMPILSDDDLSVSGTVMISVPTGVDVSNLKGALLPERPKVDRKAILAAAAATDDPTTKERIVCVLVRVFLELLLLIDFWLVKKTFKKNVFLGLIMLVVGGTVGLGLLALIIC